MYAQVSCRTVLTSDKPETFHTRNETRCSLRCCWLATPYWGLGTAEGPACGGGGGKPVGTVPPAPADPWTPATAVAAAAAAEAAWAAAMAAGAEAATAYEAAGPPVGLPAPDGPGRGCPGAPLPTPERAAAGALEGPGEARGGPGDARGGPGGALGGPEGADT